MNDIRDIILSDLSMNRDYFKNKIKLLQWTRDSMIDKSDDKLYFHIIDGYRVALVDTILEDLTLRFTDIQVQDIFCILEEESDRLVKFFEPVN